MEKTLKAINEQTCNLQYKNCNQRENFEAGESISNTSLLQVNFYSFYIPLNEGWIHFMLFRFGCKENGCKTVFLRITTRDNLNEVERLL